MTYETWSKPIGFGHHGMGVINVDTAAATAFRYFRLSIPGEANGSAGVSVNTLKLLIAGVDQAAGAVTASSSTDFGGGFTADLAFDGDVSTRWASDFSNTWPQTLSADFGLGITKNLTGLTIVSNSDTSGPTGFTLIGADNSAFTTATTLKTVVGLTPTDWTGVNYVGGTGLGLTWSIP